MPIAAVNNIHLYYEIYGSGPALMLIAGLGSDSQSWLPIIDELSQHFMLILPDNRGSGRTIPQEIETSIQLTSDDCMALLSELGIQSAALLGHSMGGFIALDCAIRYPQQVSQLILAGTSAFNSARNNYLLKEFNSYLQFGMSPEQWFRSLFYWLFSPRFFEDPNVVKEAIRLAVDYPHPQSNTAYSNQVAAIEAFNCQNELSSIRMETLIIHGRDDLLFPPEESISILQTIPNSSIALIEGAAHSIHMENPDEFNKDVLRFLHQIKVQKT